MGVDAMVFEGMEEEGEEEEIEEDVDDGHVKAEQKEYGGAGKAEEMTDLMERLKKREKKEKAADLVSKLRGKKKANKRIMPYEIYATSGE
ncbi:MAG TPA: hypothetical protein C5S37_01015 [Methanophagales archaeon]|nr:hypothetical protein [Methanophagales archaeon]